MFALAKRSREEDDGELDELRADRKVNVYLLLLRALIADGIVEASYLAVPYLTHN